jgi:hypothetical protein
MPLSEHPPTERLRALDIFRGATIAGMILVNDAGDWNKTYAPFLHAEWNGWTPTMENDHEIGRAFHWCSLLRNELARSGSSHSHGWPRANPEGQGRLARTGRHRHFPFCRRASIECGQL